MNEPREVLLIGGPKNGDVIAVNNPVIQMQELCDLPPRKWMTTGEELPVSLNSHTYTFYVEPLRLFNRTIFVAIDPRVRDRNDDKIARTMLSGTAYAMWQRAQ